MVCRLSEEELWNKREDGAPDLPDHLAWCSRCRAIVAGWQRTERLAQTILAVPPPALPEKIGPFVPKRLLGQGGQAWVYEALQPDLGRTVALKVLNGGRQTRPLDVQYFKRGIEAQAKLQHPGIATIHGANQTAEGVHYFFMEFVSGRQLHKFVASHDVPREQRDRLVCELMVSLCDAVQYAHEQGVIHRDLKPHNVQVTARGEPKILDFGLARILGPRAEDATKTLTGQGAVGTLRYMSPEQARGGRDVDGRTDVYSLGVIFFELLTEKGPYAEKSDGWPDCLEDVTASPCTALSSIRPGLPADLDYIVKRAMEKDPDERYESAAALACDIRRYLAGELVCRSRWRRLHRLRRFLDRHRRGLVRTAPLVAAAAVIIVLVWWQMARRQAWLDSAKLVDILHDSESGNATRCLASAEQQFIKHPNWPAARTVWAIVLYRGRSTQEQSMVQKALDILEHPPDPDQTWLYLALRDELVAAQRMPPRAREIPPGSQSCPQSPEDWFLLSLATLDVERARRSATRAVELDPQHALGWRRLYGLALLVGDYEQCRLTAQKLSILDDDPIWLLYEGYALLRMGRYREALERFDAVLSDGCVNTYWPYRARGTAWFCLGRYVEAAQDFTRALEVDGTSGPWNLWMRAATRRLLGRLEEAAADYENHIANYPAVSRGAAMLFLVQEEMARRLDEQGRTAEATRLRQTARQALARTLERNMRDPWLPAVVECLCGRRTPDDLTRTELATGGVEAICAAYYYAGEVYLMKGQIEQARRCFEDCVATDLVLDADEDTPDPWMEYHFAKWRLRQLQERGTVRKAAATDPRAGLGSPTISRCHTP